MMRAMTWQWSFYIQIFCTLPLWVIILLTPKEYLELNSGGGEDADTEDEKELTPSS